MPDRFGESDDPTTEPEHHPESGWEPDRLWAAEQRAAAIAGCGLCDSDGYQGALVCAHVDFRPAAARGRRLIAEVLAKVRERREGGTENG